MKSPEYDLFAVAAPGLERVVSSELQKLGFADARELPGGASFRGTFEDCFRANLRLRTATRILLRLGMFDAPGRRELAARLKRLELSKVLEPGTPVQFHVSAHASRLYHTGLITEVASETLGLPIAAKNTPAPQLHLRLVKDRVHISIDTSGELLHRRGYRQDTSRAPLRETLAAGMLLLCGYDGSEPFIDPMCGSGTIALEAGLIATGRVPNASRLMAIENFPASDPSVLKPIRDAALAEGHAAKSMIRGSDIHAGALAAAKGNAVRAGLSSLVTFDRVDVAQLMPPAPTGLILTNPPYGRRLGTDQRGPPVDEGFAALAKAFQGPFLKWHRAVVGPLGELQRALGMRLTSSSRLDNGGIAVELLQFRPAAGQRRT